MLIQIGHNSYRIIKKRAYRKRTLINKRKGKNMIAYILGSFTVLTLLTAGYNQIPPNIFTWTSNDSFVDGKINLDNAGSYKSILDAPEASKIDLKAKAVIIPVETPKEAILRIAKENDFKQGELLVKIAFCESSLKPLAVNKNTDGTSDYGIFQFNSIHKFGELPLDLEWSVKKAIEWIRAGKLHAWNSSASCWKRKNLITE